MITPFASRSSSAVSVALMDALDALMDRVESDPAVRSVVVTSGKPAFLAGADLDMVRGYTVSARSLNREQLFDLCGRLGRQFVRLEASVKKAYDSKEYKDFMAQRGFGLLWGGSTEFAGFMAKADADMKAVMTAVGIAK